MAESPARRETHLLAAPQLDRPITRRRVDDSLAAPTHSVDRGGVTAERKLELAQL